MLYLWASCTLHIHSAGAKQLPAGCRDSLSLKPFQSHLPLCFTAVGPDPRIIHTEAASTPSLYLRNLLRTDQYINMSQSTSQQHSNGEAKLSELNRCVDISCFTGLERDSESDMSVTYTNMGERRPGLALLHLTRLQKEEWEQWRGVLGFTVTAQPSTLQASFNTNRASPGSGRQAGQIEGQWLISLPC